MTEHHGHDPEGVRTGAIWLIGLAVVAITAVCTVIAWLLVLAPEPPAYAAPRSPLQDNLFETAGDPRPARAARELERCEWIDRAAGTARIPIDTAIDAVVADPGLLRSRPHVEASR